MKISKTSTVQDILDQFNEQFSHLKLEIYLSDHDSRQGSRASDQMNHQTLLIEINPSLSEKNIEIKKEMSVAEFESLMKSECNLNVQVFRKSNAIWLQTTATDHWSLEKQNGKGQRSTISYDIEPIDIRDFDVD
jgi:hypothetical protein